MLKPLFDTNYHLNSIINWNNTYNTYNENSNVTFENSSDKHKVAFTNGMPPQGKRLTGDIATAKGRDSPRLRRAQI
jgi:hypothetical protein